MIGKTELYYNGHFDETSPFGDAAAAVLGAALRARPSPLSYTRLALNDTKIESAGLTALLAGVAPPPTEQRQSALTCCVRSSLITTRCSGTRG